MSFRRARSPQGEDIERGVARGTLETTPFMLVAVVAAVIALVVLAVSGIIWAVQALL